MSDTRFCDQLHDMTQQIHRNGREQGRLAIMRWLIKYHRDKEAYMLGSLDLDAYLTAEEIAERERAP